MRARGLPPAQDARVGDAQRDARLEGRRPGGQRAAEGQAHEDKKKLLAHALERTLDEAFGNVLADFDRLRGEGLGGREAFETLFENITGNMTRYPRIAHAHLHKALVHQRYDGPAIQRLNTFLGELATRLAPATPHLSESGMRLALAQLWSSVSLPSMMPRLFDSFVRFGFGTLETRRAWVKQASRLIFTP